MLRKFNIRISRKLAPLYGPHYSVAAQGILRGLGMVYILSFWSWAAQAVPLSGPEGLQPAAEWKALLREQYGALGEWTYPSLLWLSPTGGMILILCALGTLAGLGMLFGRFPWWGTLCAWICWVSLVQACRPWLSGPGDRLLAELGLVSLFLASPRDREFPPGHKAASRLTGILLVNGLLLKVLFSSGYSKLLHGSAAWSDATAWQIFFETQPLPSTLSWFIHQLPDIVLQYGLWGQMFIELILPFYLFLPRTFRALLAAAVGVKGLFLLVTGHFGFLPFLLWILALSAVDDGTWRRLLPEHRGPPVATSMYRPGFTGMLTLCLMLPLFALQSVRPTDEPVPGPWRRVEGALSSLQASSRFALFANVPPVRTELSIQASLNGRDWIEYRFPLKPTDPRSLPPTTPLHLPRLDEQFTRLSMHRPPNSPPPIWLARLAERILTGDPATLALFPSNPFPDHPPRLVRFGMYRYRYTDPRTRREQGLVWTREFTGFYGPVFHYQLEP